VRFSEEAPPAEPAHRLPDEARTLWRLRGAVNGLVALGGAAALGSAIGGDWRWVLLLVAAAYLLLAMTVIPELRHRRWRYEVRDHEIDIRHGTFTVTRTIIPMRRVQHVETTRGLLEQGLDLATVVFHTAAGSTDIPALDVGEAAGVRTRIATLTRTADEL
jgi:membrane protein YdbS with pleckstrin-like domain